MHPQGGVYFLNCELDVMRNVLLASDLRIIENVFQQVTRFAQPVIGEELFFAVLVIAVQIHAEEVGGFVNLVHGLGAVAVVVMVTGGQDAIGPVHHVRFR